MADSTHGLPSTSLRVCVLQNSAGLDPAANTAHIEALLENAQQPDLIALPEVFSVRGSDDDYRAHAETIPGPSSQWIQETASRTGSFVLGGSILERSGNEVFNTSILADRSGELVARYRKIHLFEATLEDGKHIRESDVYSAGNEPTTAIIDGWHCGFAICYDVRFPELFRRYAENGAHILFCPANFTQRTGRDHWEILVRARAIENQCYVVAPNQCGSNPHTQVESYGNSIIAGPWGEVLARAGTDECLISTELTPETLASVRKRIPVLEHRRLTS